MQVLDLGRPTSKRLTKSEKRAASISPDAGAAPYWAIDKRSVFIYARIVGHPELSSNAR